MSPVDNVSSVMRRLRREMDRNLERLGGGEAAASAPQAAAPARQPLLTPTLRSVVARRLRALDPRDEGHPRRATEVFVETVLLTHFGDHLVNDPAFRRLMRDVGADLLADPAADGELSALFAELLRDPA